MPGFIGYQTLDLKFIRPSGLSEKYIEDHKKTYGEKLYPIMYDWLVRNDIEIFENHKPLIKECYQIKFNHEYAINFAQRVNMEYEYALNFGHRLEKIMTLYKSWLTEGRWKDPLPAIKYDENYFGSTRDRISVMRAFNVKEYEFLVIEKEALTEDRLPEIKSYYKLDGTNLSLMRDVLENNNRSSYMSRKNKNFEKWLNCSLPIKLFLDPNVRNQTTYNMRLNEKAPKSLFES